MACNQGSWQQRSRLSADACVRRLRNLTDIVDRGPDTIAIYRFFQTLRPQAEAAGGALVSLLGNHELMNSLGGKSAAILPPKVAQKIELISPLPPLSRTDWRYVTKEDIASFGGERNRREAFSTGWIGREFRTNYSITARVPYLITDDDFPASFAVQAPVLLKTPRGSSDRRFVGDPHVSPSFDAVANPFRLAAASFVHGGITPEYLASLPHSSEPISEMNRIGHELLTSLLTVPGHAPIGLPRTAPPEQREFWSERGPMWNRDWALEDEDEICERAEQACELLRVRHLIQGHTPQFEGILSRCDGKILLIDTGAFLPSPRHIACDCILLKHGSRSPPQVFLERTAALIRPSRSPTPCRPRRLSLSKTRSRTSSSRRPMRTRTQNSRRSARCGSRRSSSRRFTPRDARPKRSASGNGS